MAFHYTLPKLPSTGSRTFGGENPFSGTDQASGFRTSTSSAGRYAGFEIPTLTERQLAQLKYNLAHQHHDSFLDRVKHGAGFTLSHLLDLASRGDYAAAGAYHAFDTGGDITSGFMRGLEGKDRHTFGELLAHPAHPDFITRFLARHSKTQFAAGLTADVVLDPLTYVGIGLASKAGKAVKMGEDAVKAEKTTQSSIRAAQNLERAQRLAPDLEHQAANAAGKAASRAEAALQSNQLRHIIMDEGAHAEEAINAARHIELRLGPTLRTSLRVRTPLKLRGTQLQKIERLSEAAKGGKFTAQIRKGLKDRFHAGWDMPVIHRMKQAAVVHGLRKWAEGHWHFSKETLEPYVGKHGAEKLTEAEQAKALAAGDKVGVVNPKTHDINDAVLEENLIQQGFTRGSGSLQKAVGYLHAWHAVTERLLHFNEAAGVKLEEDARYAFEEGRMYVPRRVNPNHTAQARFSLPELAKTQGIQRKRSNALDFESILKGIADGSIHPQSALHNPNEMLAQIVNESSTAQVSALFKDAVRKAFGVDRKVFDRTLADNKFARKIEKKQTDLERLRTQLAASTVEHLSAEAARDFANTRDGNAAIRRAEGAKIKAAEKQIADLQPMRKQVVRTTPEARAKITARTPEAVRLNSLDRQLSRQIRETEKPLTEAEVKDLKAIQEQHITRLQEQLNGIEYERAGVPQESGLEPATESAIHAEDLNSKASEALNQAWERNFERYTEAQGAALEHYILDSRAISNTLDTLRGKALDPLDGMHGEDVIHDIDQAFLASEPAPHEFFTYHGSQFARKTNGLPEVGDVADVHTFISTSTDQEVAKAWAGHLDVNHPFKEDLRDIAEGYAANVEGARVFKALYRIKVPKGTRTIGNLTGFDQGPIDEVMLQRGGKLRIKAVSKPDKFGIHHIDAEFIPPKPASTVKDASQLRRQLEKAKETLNDPEALRRKYRSSNYLKAQRGRVRSRLKALHETARKQAPDGTFRDISFWEHKAPGGRGHVGGSYVTFQKGDKGFMQLTPAGKGRNWASVGMVRVLPEFQKQGIGRELYEAALAYMETKGMNALLPADLQSDAGKAMWESLKRNPPKGWTVDAPNGSLVYDSTRTIKIARAHKAIKDANRTLEALPPAKQVRLEHAQKLVDIANDPKRIKSTEEMNKRAVVLERGIAKLKPKALRAMYKDNPAAMRQDLVHAIALDQHGIGGVTHEYAIPAALNEHLQRVMEALINPRKQDALDHTIRKAMTEWKKLVTTVNPGYWTRNTVSDFWNMYIADVPVWAMAKYATKAARVMRAAHNGDRKAQQYLLEFEARGGGSGLFIGDIRDMKANLTKSKSRYQRITGKQVDLNGLRENWGRLVHYMYRTESEGMSHAQAAWHVREAHFDYTDLTEWEQKKAKAIAPFYTWTRKNVPYQLKKLFTRPGRIAAYQKIASNSEIASGQPAYTGPLSQTLLGKPLSFRVGDTYINPQIGLQDLFTTNPLTDEGRQGLLGQLSPQFKIPLELVQNRSTFTGEPIYGDQARAQTGASWLSSLLGGGQTLRDYGNGPHAYPSVPWWANYAGRQIPAGSFALSFDDPAAAQRGGDVAGVSPKVFSYVFGLSAANPNPEYERIVSKAQADEKFKLYWKWLQDAGKASISPRQPASVNQRTVDQSTYAAFGR